MPGARGAVQVLGDAAPDVPIWPCNLDAFQIAEATRTQWRIGMAGPVGMDYACLPAVMDLVGIPIERRREVFAQMREVEAEALRVMRDGRK